MSGQHGPLRRLLGAATAVLLGLGLALTGPQAAQAQEPCADLSITGFSVTPSQPVQGQPATFTVTVRNTGTCAAPGFVVQWRQNPLAPSGPSTPVASLAANTSTALTFAFTFPTAGNFETVAVVDSANSVAETNEANNLALLPVTVVAATVDLVVTSLNTVPARPVSGRVATGQITITNNGNTAAGAFLVSWRPWPLAATLTQQVSGLAAGQSRVISIDFTFPVAGAWPSTVTVDSANAVRESNEGNNTLTRTLNVDLPRADLVVSAVVLTPSAPVVGQSTTASITVTNTGNTAATEFRVQWRPRLLAPPVSIRVAGLAAGAATTVQLAYTYPFAGTFPGTVTVDPDRQVTELNETNNTFQLQVVVAPNTVDLMIEDVTINPSSPTQAAPATVSIRIRNTGNTAAGPFLVEWNPDALFVSTPSLSTVSQQVNGLGAGATTTITFTFAYPRAGNFNTVARVDAFNNVSETNEANNRFVRAVTVQPAPIDLVITSFTLDPASPVRGLATTARITVRNNGPIATGPFWVQWRLRQSDPIGPTARIGGLNAGESQTVTLQGTYLQTGTVTTSAVVDVFNQVVEPGGGENNNTVTRSATVVPQRTTLRVTLASLRSFADGDEGLAGTGEWNPIIVGVLDPTATCTVLGQTVPDVRCFTFADNDVDDNSQVDLPANRSIVVTLEEAAPLAAVVTVLEDDSPLAPQFLGFASLLSFPPAYRTLGTQTIDGQQGDCATAPRCFQATLQVEVVSSNVPASALAAQAQDQRLNRGAAAKAGSLPKADKKTLVEFRRVLDQKSRPAGTGE
ncbi:CARDB domain-containing protein [Micromonospora qiuiae]|uniref:CARDB domain-containing protein n=1 Tax=Micromonospora qiuiae TaxID=502268 RepID=UPI00194E963E|nr:CARDB domain-containing protein [Micromonospora qiuiae]